MNPGATIRPRASNFASAPPLILPGGAISATRPSRRRTSIDASIRAAGSIRCPPLISKLDGFFALTAFLWAASRPRTRPPNNKSSHLSHFAQRARQDCHARGNTVVNFFNDPRLRTVSDLIRELHTADNRSGVHDDGVALGQLEAR